ISKFIKNIFQLYITIILLEQAQILLYLDDLKKTNFSTRFLEEVH
ncbi:17584_t:CDS:2, partial [Racocetra persica]